MEKRSPAEVIHLAVAEYLHAHKDQLASRLAESQRAVSSGDLEALAKLLGPGAQRMTDELLEDLDRLR
jgi:hypothetical protein